MSISQLKARAVCATGNLPEMLALADSVAHSSAASGEQIALSKATIRSIRAELSHPSKTKREVALIRYAKLVSNL
ncbi:MAG TPA: hypothetical protein VGO04_24745 [Ensifer sp.]|jgi:hypothetical protein|uniref:hypothetical protein n=1 Tax=Ensifer sp. TaxID=1872086 RepID=UPI002E10A2A5|nr:hypothetical protein [Ensifer sp.]